MNTKSLEIRLPAISFQSLKEFSFILFLCIPFIQRALASVLYGFGLSYLSMPITILIVYFPVLLLFFMSPRDISIDFFVLIIAIVAFAAVTLLIHPEYKYWYMREDYGVWPYVLRPDNGLYIYLFIRLLNDPEAIHRGLKKSAWIMYVYYAYLLVSALRLGYWEQQNWKGEIVEMSYNLTFGYDLLLYAVVFLFDALNKKRLTDFVMAVAGIVMILLGGSRGPLLCVALFLIVYVFSWVQKKKNKTLILILLIMLAGIIYLFFTDILNGFIRLCESVGIESRTISMLAEGSIADDNGRDRIWAAAAEMIRANPLGYGMMGTRHVISSYHIVGHSHQIFLEILVDFGVVLGGVIIIAFFIGTIQMLVKKELEEWRGVFLVFLGRLFHLLLSGTFWHVNALWACLAIYVCAKTMHRKQQIQYRSLM